MNNRLNSHKQKLKEFFIKVYQSEKEQASFLEDFYLEYLKTGKSDFEYKAIVFGREKIVKYEVSRILQQYSYGFKIPKAIVDFENNSNNISFTELLNAYYYDVLVNARAFLESKQIDGVLHTDLCMTLLLTLSYFPDKIEIISNQLIRFLEENSQKLEKYAAQEFGRGSLLYLVVEMLKLRDFSAHAATISKFCIKPIACYQEAFESAISNDEQKFSDAIEELTAFHLSNSKADLTLPFNHERWQYMPMEIISLIQLFVSNGDRQLKEISLVSNLNSFVYLPIELSEETLLLESRILC
nr:hypothetical protein [Pedobacter kyonggii]